MNLRPSLLINSQFIGLVLFLLASNMSFGFSGPGSGTEADPYLISTAAQLDEVRNNLTAHYRLVNDINLGVAPWNQGKGWLPIGDKDNLFAGSLDGDGFSVNNVLIHANDVSLGPRTLMVGLFAGTGPSGIIENLSATGVFNIYYDGNPKNQIGLISGRNEGIIRNVQVTINVAINYDLVDAGMLMINNLGGVTGWNIGEIHNGISNFFINCRSPGQDGNVWMERLSHIGGISGRHEGVISGSTANIYADIVHGYVTNLGGFVGANQGSISDSNTTGEMKITMPAGTGVGGFAGRGIGSFTNCRSSVNIEFNQHNVIVNWSGGGRLRGIGGFVGHGSNGVYDFCSTQGQIIASGGEGVGGFMGAHGDTFGYPEYPPQHSNIKRSYSAVNIQNLVGDVMYGGGDHTGGFIGLARNITIQETYSTGSVNGSVNAGGFVGYALDSTFEDSFTFSSVNAATTGGGFVGRSHQSTFARTYASNTISGDSSSFVHQSTDSVYVNSYWNQSRSSSGSNPGITPYSQAAFSNQNNFPAWDFEDVWIIQNGFPRLRFLPDNLNLEGTVLSARFPNRPLRGIHVQTNTALPINAVTGWDGIFMLEDIFLPLDADIIASHPDWWADENNAESASISVSIPRDHSSEDIPTLLFDSFRSKGQSRVTYSLDKQVARPGETVVVTVTLENIGLPLVGSNSYLDLSFADGLFEVGELTGDGWDMIEHYPPGSTIYTAEGGTMTAVDHLVSAARLNGSFSLSDQFQMQIPLTVKPGIGDQVIHLRVRGTIGDHITPDVDEGRPKDQQGYFYWSLPVVVIDDISDLPGWEFSPESNVSVSVYLQGRNGQEYDYPLFFPLLAPFDGDDAASATFTRRFFGLGRDNLRDYDKRKDIYRGLIREMVTQANDEKQKLAITRALIQTANFTLAEEHQISDVISLIASYDIENETTFSQIPKDATYALKLAETLAKGAATGSIPADKFPAVNSLGTYLNAAGIGLELLNISATAAFYEAIATDLALSRLDYLEQQNPFKAVLVDGSKDEAWEDALDEVRNELERILSGDRWTAYFLAWQDHWPSAAEGGLKVIYGALVTGLNIGWGTVPIAWDYFFKQTAAYEDAYFLATAALKVSQGLRYHGAVHPFRNEMILAAESIVYRAGIEVVDNQTYFSGKVFSSSSDIFFPSLRNQYRNRKAQVDQAYADATIPLGHAIVGQITNQDGEPLSGVSINLSGAGIQTTTREDGQFFAVVFPGWTGDVIPSFSTGEFDPTHRSYSPVSANVLGADFVLHTPIELPIWSVSLAASPPSGGSVSGAGNYVDGNQVAIQATLASGYRFAGWSGASGIGNPSSLSTTVSATSNKSLVANFVKVWNLHLSSDDPVRGSVSGGGTFDEGQSVPITASPQSGFRFGGWSGGTVSNPDAPQTSVVLNSDLSLSASFLINASEGYNRFAERFGGETDIARIGPMADFSGNGIPNILEYALAINPDSPEASRPIRSMEKIQAGEHSFMGIEVHLRRDDPEITYYVEVSSDLTQWENVILSYSGGQWVADKPGIVSIHSSESAGDNTSRLILKDGTAMDASSARFIRVGVSHPY